MIFIEFDGLNSVAVSHVLSISPWQIYIESINSSSGCTSICHVQKLPGCCSRLFVTAPAFLFAPSSSHGFFTQVLPPWQTRHMTVDYRQRRDCEVIFWREKEKPRWGFEHSTLGTASSDEDRSSTTPPVLIRLLILNEQVFKFQNFHHLAMTCC